MSVEHVGSAYANGRELGIGGSSASMYSASSQDQPCPGRTMRWEYVLALVVLALVVFADGVVTARGSFPPPSPPSPHPTRLLARSLRPRFRNPRRSQVPLHSRPYSFQQPTAANMVRVPTSLRAKLLSARVPTVPVGTAHQLNNPNPSPNQVQIYKSSPNPSPNPPSTKRAVDSPPAPDSSRYPMIL